MDWDLKNKLARWFADCWSLTSDCDKCVVQMVHHSSDLVWCAGVPSCTYHNQNGRQVAFHPWLSRSAYWTIFIVPTKSWPTCTHVATKSRETYTQICNTFENFQEKIWKYNENFWRNSQKILKNKKTANKF